MTGYEGSRQDWLEGQASDQLEREAHERERSLRVSRGWLLSVDEEGLTIILGHGAVPFRHRPMALTEAVNFAHAILAEVEIAQQPVSRCDVCDSTEIADCICGEMYLCAEHLAAWEASPISHDEMDRFIAEQRATRG